MKKYKLIIFSLFLALGMVGQVSAASLAITAPSSANVSTDFSVVIKHTGDTLGSLQMQVAITNAECSVASTCSGGVANCNGGSCLMSFNLTSGLAAGNNIMTLTCSSTGGTAKFVASIVNNDAWDVEGLKQISVSSASKSVTINGTTTTSNKTTTQTTVTKRSTTAASTKTTTTTTTTKKTTTTTKKTTTVKEGTTTTVAASQEITQVLDDDEEELTTDTTTTTTTTTVYVPDDLKLSELKIVGYNINFKPNLVSYTIDVEESVNELYLIATPVDSETQIEGVGLIDITDKDYIQIRVYNDNAKHEINYKIYIRRQKLAEEHSFIGNVLSDSYKLIIFSMVGVIFALIAFFTLKSIIKGPKEEEEKKENLDSENKEEIIPTTEEELMELFDELENSDNE